MGSPPPGIRPAVLVAGAEVTVVDASSREVIGPISSSARS